MYQPETDTASPSGALGTDVAVFVIGQVQDLTHVMQDQVNETRQLRAEIRDMMREAGQATSSSNTSKDRSTADLDGGNFSRERKMNGNTVRGQLREQRVQGRAQRQRGRRAEDDDPDDIDNDGDDEDEDDVTEHAAQEWTELDALTQTKHLNRLKVSAAELPLTRKLNTLIDTSVNPGIY